MKHLILLFSILILFSCTERKEVYETEIKTYVISHKEIANNSRGPDSYYIYFQTPTSTECASVSEGTYNKYEVGDTISVLIKYWEKPKKK